MTQGYSGILLAFLLFLAASHQIEQIFNDEFITKALSQKKALIATYFVCVNRV